MSFQVESNSFQIKDAKQFLEALKSSKNKLDYLIPLMNQIGWVAVNKKLCKKIVKTLLNDQEISFSKELDQLIEKVVTVCREVEFYSKIICKLQALQLTSSLQLIAKHNCRRILDSFGSVEVLPIYNAAEEFEKRFNSILKVLRENNDPNYCISLVASLLRDSNCKKKHIKELDSNLYTGLSGLIYRSGSLSLLSTVISCGYLEPIKEILSLSLSYGNNIFHYWINSSRVDLLKIVFEKINLVEVGQLLLQPNHEEVTPLLLAAKSGNLEILQLFAKHQSDLFTSCGQPVYLEFFRYYQFHSIQAYISFIDGLDGGFDHLKIQLFFQLCINICPSFLKGEARLKVFAIRLLSRLLSKEHYFSLFTHSMLKRMLTFDAIAHYLLNNYLYLLEEYWQKELPNAVIQDKYGLLPLQQPCEIKKLVDEIANANRSYLLGLIVIDRGIFERPVTIVDAIIQCYQSWISSVDWHSGETAGTCNIYLQLIGRLYSYFPILSIAVAAADLKLSKLMAGTLKALQPVHQMVVIPMLSVELLIAELQELPLEKQANFLSMATKAQKISYVQSLDVKKYLPQFMLDWSAFMDYWLKQIDDLKNGHNCLELFQQCRENLTESSVRIESALQKFNFLIQKISSNEDFSGDAEPTIIKLQKVVQELTWTRGKLKEMLEQLEAELKTLKIVEERVPDEFICPISCSVMTDPVSTEDGKIYDRSAIEAWFAIRRADEEPLTSPASARELTTDLLVPEDSLRHRIQKFQSNET